MCVLDAERHSVKATNSSVAPGNVSSKGQRNMGGGNGGGRCHRCNKLPRGSKASVPAPSFHHLKCPACVRASDKSVICA